MSLLRTWRSSYVAALLAVALLSLAGERSTVMQIAMSAPRAMPECGHMLGSRHTQAPENPTKSCGYCAVAGHLPICDAAPPPLQAPTAVAFIAWRAIPGLGPRGPPARDPRSRSPPGLLVTA